MNSDAFSTLRIMRTPLSYCGPFSPTFPHAFSEEPPKAGDHPPPLSLPALPPNCQPSCIESGSGQTFQGTKTPASSRRGRPRQLPPPGPEQRGRSKAPPGAQSRRAVNSTPCRLSFFETKQLSLRPEIPGWGLDGPLPTRGLSAGPGQEVLCGVSAQRWGRSQNQGSRGLSEAL